MTADLVNLRRARKTKARKMKESESAANRVAHGRTPIERETQSLEAARSARMLDGHRREVPPDKADGIEA